MSLLLTLDGLPRLAFYKDPVMLPFIDSQYQAFSGLLGPRELRRKIEVMGQVELPNVDADLDNGQDQLTTIFRDNPPFKVRAELLELRDNQLKTVFVGSVLGIVLGSLIKLMLES